jgi:glycosyltransferase involved in cell wall biosynthesis
MPGDVNKNDMKHEVDLSVVLPVMNEKGNVGNMVDELMAVLEGLKLSYEVIAINVPDRENSYEVLETLGEKYPNFFPVKVLYLGTKGYQKSYQYSLGFRKAHGKRVVQMDSDYQDNPHDLSRFLEKLDEGFDMVVGWKQNRKDPFFYKLTSLFQNTLSRLVTGIQLHDKNCGYKAYTRAAADSLQLYGMNYRDIPLQLAAKGFKIAEIPIDNRKRIEGKSNFTFINRLLGGTVDFLAALFVAMMLDKPFRLWAGMGFAVGILGVLVEVAFVVWLLITGGTAGLNWWVVLWVLLGVLMMIKSMVLFGIGIVTEYIRSLQKFRVSEYAILEDPKGVVQRD